MAGLQWEITDRYGRAEPLWENEMARSYYIRVERVEKGADEVDLSNEPIFLVEAAICTSFLDL